MFSDSCAPGFPVPPAHIRLLPGLTHSSQRLPTLPAHLQVGSFSDSSSLKGSGRVRARSQGTGHSTYSGLWACSKTPWTECYCVQS